MAQRFVRGFGRTADLKRAKVAEQEWVEALATVAARLFVAIADEDQGRYNDLYMRQWQPLQDAARRFYADDKYGDSLRSVINAANALGKVVAAEAVDPSRYPVQPWVPGKTAAQEAADRMGMTIDEYAEWKAEMDAEAAMNADPQCFDCYDSGVRSGPGYVCDETYPCNCAAGRALSDRALDRLAAANHAKIVAAIR